MSMKIIKNSILWILCVLNYAAYGLIYISAFDTPNVEFNMIIFVISALSGLYFALISELVAVIEIIILICKWIKNKTLPKNRIILLTMNVLYLILSIPMALQLLGAFLLASAFGI